MGIREDKFNTFQNIKDILGVSADFIPSGFTLIETSESGSDNFIGYSTPGNPSSDNNWFIIKVTTSGGDTSRRFSFSGSWDDRANLNYI